MDGRLRRHPRKFALPKAFQLNASRLVVFFNAPRFTKVNFRHLFALKKPVTFVTGFVANIVLHSNQMWRDLRELHKLAKVYKMLKINDFDQNKWGD